MRYVRWNRGLETGESDVDEQHRALYSLVNDLNVCVLLGDDDQQVSATLQRTLRHTVEHFKSEEELMEQWDYPLIEEHTGTHREFSENVANLLDAQLSGEGPSIQELAEHMGRWLETHVRTDDRLLADHIRAQKLHKT